MVFYSGGYLHKSPANNGKDETTKRRVILQPVGQNVSILSLTECGSLFIGQNWQGGNLISVIFGEKYREGKEMLSIHVLTNIPVFLGVGSGIWIILEGKQNQLLAKAIIGGVVSLFTNWILIPHLGLMGAAITSVLAQLASTLGSNYFIDRTLFCL